MIHGTDTRYNKEFERLYYQAHPLERKKMEWRENGKRKARANFFARVLVLIGIAVFIYDTFKF